MSDIAIRKIKNKNTNSAKISAGEAGGTINPNPHVQIYHKTAVARFGPLIAKKDIVDANVTM